MKDRSRVLVIGGGISGLATAWWLHKASIDVTLLELGRETGGTMQTTREKGWLVEKGPNSALETTPLFSTLCNDVGIADRVEYANDRSKNRYILRSGVLHPLPMSPGAFLRSDLWSLSGKLRLFKEPFIGRGNGEETVAEFVRRRLGKEFLDYAINPFVAGVFAGNPEELSVRAAFPKLYALEQQYGGLIKGQILGSRERKKRQEKAKDRARMFAFKDGMQVFPRAIASALGRRVVRSCRVEEIKPVERRKGRFFEIQGKLSGKPFVHRAEAVITALPSFITADLVQPLDTRTAHSLQNLPYPPVAEVFLGFRSSDIRRELDGFGFLVPEREGRKVLGTIWSSSIFPGRAPEGFAALTTFVGGSRQPELAELSDNKLVTMVKEELRSIMGVEGKPAYVRVTRWKKAIPQYMLGHGDIIAAAEQFETRHPGLFLSGNWRGGISVGDCVVNSEKVFFRVRAFLDGRAHE